MTDRLARRLTLLAIMLCFALPAQVAAQAKGKPAPSKAAAAQTGAARGETTSAEDENAALLRKAGLSRARGSNSAEVTVYEVGDFQCPFCAQFANQTFGRIDSSYIRPGRVQWVFVNMPLVIHPNAFQAAEAALCAGAVADRFWAMHERLYDTQPQWTGAADPHSVFLGYAKALGVPEAPYSACIKAERVWPVILRDATYAAAAQIDGTPTYIIGNQVVAVGAKTWDEWKAILDKALQDAAAKKSAAPAAPAPTTPSR